jgi:hypothetical protein
MGQLARTLRRQQHKIKPIVDVRQTILYRNPSHWSFLRIKQQAIDASGSR